MSVCVKPKLDKIFKLQETKGGESAAAQLIKQTDITSIYIIYIIYIYKYSSKVFTDIYVYACL